MIKNFPLKHKVLHHASFCNFELRMEAEISSIEFFIERYPVFFESLNLDDLHDEFVLYKTSPDLTPEMNREVSNCDRNNRPGFS